jgi:hypothetical protein
VNLVKLKPKSTFFALATILLFALGCGSQHSSHEGSLVFKGQVVKVEYQLSTHTTLLFDSEGKTTTLHGHPGVPCAEVEIYEENPREYRIYRGTPSS